MFPGKGSQARFPGTASQARLLGRGSEAKFPGRGSQARVPSCSWKFCLGTSSSWGRLLENLFLRALFLLGTLLGNGSWDLAWEPLLEPYLQAIPGKRTLLGNLFLDTVYLRKGGKKRFPRIGSQARGFQAMFLGTGFQARFARPGSKARIERKD